MGVNLPKTITPLQYTSTEKAHLAFGGLGALSWDDDTKRAIDGAWALCYAAHDGGLVVCGGVKIVDGYLRIVKNGYLRIVKTC